jgi:hypothetical protein
MSFKSLTPDPSPKGEGSGVMSLFQFAKITKDERSAK